LVLLGELEDLNLLRLATFGRVYELELARLVDYTVLCSVLVAKGVTADDNGFLFRI